MSRFAKFVSAVSLLAAVVALPLSVEAQQIEIPWEQDLDRAVKVASEENKLILLHFTADWCRPCKSLETFVFNSPMVVAAVEENVVPVKVDVDLHKNLVKEYGVSGVPFDVAVTPAGRVVMRRKSPQTIAGYTRMVSSITRAEDELSKSNPQLSKNLKSLQDRYQPQGNPLLRNEDFTPDTPSTNVPVPNGPSLSTNGERLARSVGRQHNPFYQGETSRDNVARISSDEAQRNIETRIKRNSSDFAPGSVSRSQNSVAKVISNPHAARGSDGVKIVKNEYLPDPVQRSPERQLVRTELPSDQFVQPRPPSPPQLQEQVKEPQFALKGKCPVSLLKDGKWQDGNKQFGCVHRGRVYLFASQDYQKVFQAEPDAYSPILAGFDPVLFHTEGRLIEGDTVHGVFMGRATNKRVVLFTSKETRAKFQTEPKVYLEAVRQAMLRSDRQNKMR